MAIRLLQRTLEAAEVVVFVGVLVGVGAVFGLWAALKLVGKA